MPTTLSANSLIDSQLPILQQNCNAIINKGFQPKLTVMLIGNNPASIVYIRNKKRFCEKVGIDFELIELNENVTQEEVKNKILDINNDPKVSGFFIQFPVPKHLDSLNIPQLINPRKDVDGFHFENIKSFYQGDNSGLLPCTPKGILSLFKHYNIQLEGKNITIIGRSSIVGKPLSILLTNENATVTLCHSRTQNITSITKSADIIVCAIGIPHYLDKTFLNSEKSQIIIDVGINRLEGKLVGDVNYNDVYDHVKAITPVPGGVGPLTVLSLMQNILTASEGFLNE